MKLSLQKLNVSFIRKPQRNLWQEIIPHSNPSIQFIWLDFHGSRYSPSFNQIAAKTAISLISDYVIISANLLLDFHSLQILLTSTVRLLHTR